MCFCINDEKLEKKLLSMDIHVLNTGTVVCAVNETIIIEPRHEISNNVVCAPIKASDQPVHTRSLMRDFASRLNIL